MKNIIRLDKKVQNSEAYIYKSSIGDLKIHSDINYEFITSIEFNDDQTISENKEEPEIIKQVKRELDNYFSESSSIIKSFSVPLALYGTDFQYNVWCETYKIPFGEFATYSNIALKIKNNLGSISRAVGSAQSKNPIIIIIPCHRIIGKNMKLTGYAGGIDKKELLLKHEGFNIINSKVIVSNNYDEKNL